MRLPRPRTLILLLAIVAWAGAVGWYWRTQLPVRPTAVIPLGREELFLGCTSSGRVLVCRESATARWMKKGPVRVIDARTGRVEREILDRKFAVSDAIAGECVVARKDDVTRLIDTHTGTVKWELAVDLAGDLPKASPEGRYLAFQSEDWSRKLRVFRVEDGTMLWDAPCGGARQFVGPDLIQFVTGGVGWDLRECATGRDGPKGIDAARILVISPDGRSMLVQAGPRDRSAWQLIDLSTGQARWTTSLPHPTVQQIEFTCGGSQFALPFIAGKRVRLARWESSNGEPLAPLPSDAELASFFVHPRVDTCLIVHHRIEAWAIPDSVDRLATAVGLKTSGELTPARRCAVILDARDGRTLGSVPDVQRTEPCGAGFVATDDASIRYYDLPPRRNWPWLLGWSLAPPAALCLVTTAWRRRRRPRSADP